MLSSSDQTKLWASADKLRTKYVSNAFSAQRQALKTRFADPNDLYFLPDASAADLERELEDRDYYTEPNVFWVPETARWEQLQSSARRPGIGALIFD